MPLMVTQLVTVALRVRAMGSRTAIANGILISGLIESLPEPGAPPLCPDQYDPK